jgi:hypothetical protein
MDRSKMVFAGVDAGAKMFVELKGDPGEAAPASVVKQINNNARILIASRMVKLCRFRMFHTKRAASDAVWLGVLGNRRTSLPWVIRRYLQGVMRFFRRTAVPKASNFGMCFDRAFLQSVISKRREDSTERMVIINEGIAGTRNCGTFSGTGGRKFL